MKNARPLDSELFSIFNPGRQKLCKGTKTPKSLDPDKNFKPQHIYLDLKIDFEISGNSDNSRATLFSDQLGVEATNI